MNKLSVSDALNLAVGLAKEPLNNLSNLAH